MTIRIVNFTIITGATMNAIAYNYDILNADGTLKSNNNRASIQITNDSVLLSAINTANIMEISNAIKNYLVKNTTI